MISRNVLYILITCITILAVNLITQCGASARKSEPPEEKPRIIEKKPQKEVPEPVPTAIDLIHTRDGKIGWAGIFIGGRLESVQAVIDKSFQTEETILSTCGGASADTKYKDRELWLQFSGEDPGSKLESMLIVFNERELQLDAEQLKSYLKSHLPELSYQPSIHREDLSEAENRTPVYVLQDNREMAILLKPGEGFYLAYSICLD